MGLSISHANLGANAFHAARRFWRNLGKVGTQLWTPRLLACRMQASIA
jgi:hypothetical protein